MYSKLSSTQLAKADVVIKPKVAHIGSADFSKRHEAILEGEKAAIEALPQITAIITQLRLLLVYWKSWGDLTPGRPCFLSIL